MEHIYDEIEGRQFFFDCREDDGETSDVWGTPNEVSNLMKYSRMSMSSGDVSHLERALDLGIITGNQEESLNVEPSRDKNKYEKSNVTQRIQRSSSSQSGLNRLAMPKKYFSSVENLYEYVPMAEAVRKFQVSTQERFRSKQENKVPYVKMHITKPKTPHLTTKSRARPLTYEEKEFLEFQEQQKFKIKAHPLNKKILQGPIKPKVIVDKKTATIPEPFHLTEVHPKVIEEPKISEFHAKPVPKSLYNPNKLKFEKGAVTIPKTPSFMKSLKVVHRVFQDKVQKEPATTSVHPRGTVVVPFSFEIRNQMLKKKKEDAIRQVFEEEKKARIFKANPVPKKVLHSSKNLSSNSNTNRRLKKTESSEEKAVVFKAKPATVLQKKQPIKKSRLNLQEK